MISGVHHIVTVRKKPEAVSTRRSTRPRGMATQGKILSAAVAAITERGFDGVSTYEVAQRAGVNQSLVMYHFPSKEELCWEAASRIVDNFFESLLAMVEIAEGVGPADNLKRIFHAFIDFSAEHPELHRFMIEANKRRSTQFLRMAEEHLRPASEFFRKQIQQAQSAGCMVDGDPDILHYVMVGAAATLFSLPVEFEYLTGRAASEKAVVEGVKEVFDRLFFSSPSSDERSSPVGEEKGGNR
jgi:TetR/AcrR family transcriptional regulator